MSILFDNNASATLSVQAEIVDTTLTLQTNEGQLFPSPSGSDFFICTLEDTSGNFEIVQCTSRASDVLTVTRAQENTTAKVFPTGSKVEIRTTAGTFDEFVQQSGDTMSGNLDMNGNEVQDALVTTTGSAVIQGVPIRGSDNGTGNELVVPSAGADPTIGGNVIVTKDDADSDYVPQTRTITSGEGITGGGDLTANRTLDLDIDSLTELDGADVAATDSYLVFDQTGTEHKKIEHRDAGIPIITDSGTNPVPTSDQVNSYWICTNASTINFDIDTGVGVPGNVILVEQGGAGVVDFTGGTATINSAYINDTTNGQNTVVVLICTTANTWTLYGDAT